MTRYFRTPVNLTDVDALMARLAICRRCVARLGELLDMNCGIDLGNPRLADFVDAIIWRRTLEELVDQIEARDAD